MRTGGPYNRIERWTALRSESGAKGETVPSASPLRADQSKRTRNVDFIGVPYGIRTRVTAVKGRCPRPLDEGDEAFQKARWV